MMNRDETVVALIESCIRLEVMAQELEEEAADPAIGEQDRSRALAKALMAKEKAVEGRALAASLLK